MIMMAGFEKRIHFFVFQLVIHFTFLIQEQVQMFKLYRIVAVLVCAPFILASSALGQTFVGSLSVESNSDESDPGNNVYTYFNEISVATLDDFDFAFSSLGDVDFSVTWQAPAGQLIKITPPSGFDSTQVIFQMFTGLSGYNVGQVLPTTTLSLTDFTGSTLPTMTPSAQFTGPQTSSLPADNAGAFVIASGYAFDEPFFLSSATVEFSVPASYDVDFNAPLIDFNVFGVAFSQNPNTPPTDPGQWITLVEIIPAPSALGGALLMGALLGARRRGV